MKFGRALLSLGCTLAFLTGSNVGCSSGTSSTNGGSGGGNEGGKGGDTDNAGGKGGESTPEGGRAGQQTTGGNGGTNATTTTGAGGSTPVTGGSTGKTGGTNGTTTSGAMGGGTGGTMGGSTGGVVSACGHPICDDFEAYPTGKRPGLPWNQTAQGSAPLNVETGNAYSGTKSVKISIPAADGAEGTFSQTLAPLQPATDVWSRMMVFLDGAPGGSGLHWSWMQASGSISKETNGEVPFATFGSGGHPSTMQTILLGLPKGGGLMDCWNHSNDPVPTNKWACVEWHLDSVADKVELYIDGNKINAQSFTLNPTGSNGCLNGRTGGQWYVPALSSFKFGWTHYHSLSQARTMYIDDIALDKKRINCPPKK